MSIRRYFKKIKTGFYTWKIKRTCGSSGRDLKVNGFSAAGRNVHLGKNVNFNGMVITGGGNVTIGNNFHSGRNCMILVRYHNYEGTRIPYDETYINKSVVIDDNVWLGHNVIILGGVHIGEGAIIQAGSVVSRSIPALSIAGGNPAKPFKERNAEHYYSLKEKQMFF